MNELMNILIVENYTELSNILKEILEDEGYIVFTVLDGHSAIELCRSQQFDLVLLIHHLPDMNGMQLIQRMADISDAEYIMMANRYEVEVTPEVLHCKKFIGYESKPVNIKRLLSNIRQADQRRKEHQL